MQPTFPSHKTSCKTSKATHISSFLFNCQLSTKSECCGVVAFESSLTLPASAKASYVSTSSSTGPGGKVACRRESMSTSGFHLWYNHASSLAVMRPCIGHSIVVRQNPGSPSPQLKGPHQSVGVHGGDEQEKSVKGGENQKMPYPQCGRSVETYARGNNDAPSITKYGSPVRLDAQIVGLLLRRPHTLSPTLSPLCMHATPGLSGPCDPASWSPFVWAG